MWANSDKNESPKGDILDYRYRIQEDPDQKGAYTHFTIFGDSRVYSKPKMGNYMWSYTLSLLGFDFWMVQLIAKYYNYTQGYDEENTTDAEMHKRGYKAAQ